MGARELASRLAAYVASLTFAVSFLVTTVTGGGGLLALGRAVLMAGIAWCVLPWLLRPAVTTLLDAMARDQVERAE